MTAPTAIVPTAPRKALVVLGPDQVVVRFGPDHHLQRWQRRVRLDFGIHLYSAGPWRKNPNGYGSIPTDEAKVVPFEPGYSVLVDAMGGKVVAPPVVTVGGVSRMNPTPVGTTSTGTAYRYEALAYCLLRNPMDGSVVMSVGSAVFDARLTFLQSLVMKKGRRDDEGDIQRDDILRLVADEAVEEARQGPCKGWASYPTGAGITILLNPASPLAREKIAEYMNLCKTAGQQAVTKASRIACDRNPVLRSRCVWTYGDLIRETRKDRDGKVVETGARYAEVTAYGWAEEAGPFDARLANLYANLETQVLDVIDADEEANPEASLDPDIPQIEQRPDDLSEGAHTPEPVPVAANADPEPKAEARPLPEPAAPTAVKDAMTPAVERLLRSILSAENRMEPGARNAARAAAGLGTNLRDHTEVQLRAYAARLSQE